MNKVKIAVGLGTVAVVAALALGGVGYAFAQSSTLQTEAATLVSNWQGGGPFGHHGPDGGGIDHEAIEAAAAQALGMTVEELQTARQAGKTLETLATEKGVDIATVQAAMEAARTDAVNKAVADGTITQAQADDILSRPIGLGGPGGPGGHGDGGLLGTIFSREAKETVVADALGITVEELQTARSEGKTLETLATEKGVDIAAVQSAVETARTDAVNKAVAAGTITQAQADEILSRPVNLLGGPGGHGDGGFGGVMATIFSREDVQATVAGALNMTVEELQAAKSEGKTLETIATEQGVDIATVQTALETARTEAVNKAVAAGTITQAQADEILSRPVGLGGPGGHHGGGFGGGRPPFSGPNDQAPSTVPATPTTTPND